MSNSLFNEFPKITAKQWKQKIQFELKGEDYNETLVTKTPEGIHIKPFYNQEDLPENISSNPNPAWRTCEKVFAGNAASANKKILNSVDKGAESILLIFPSEEIALNELLQNVPLEEVAIHVQMDFLSVDFIKKLIEITENKNASVFLQLDIIGNLARSGNWFFNKEKDTELFYEIQEIVKAHQHVTSSLSIDTNLYQNAGANMLQQLAYGIAHANEYLNLNDQLVSNITFKTSLGSHYFFEIAKLKALRKLWEALATEYQIDGSCYLFCTPSKRNKTIYDYNVNMLRTTTEYMSAILGGGNTICTLPYDYMYHKDNEFASRIARNQLLILKHESYFDKVLNPVDGTYYIESLTEELTEQALKLFKSIEAGGGFLKHLKEHTIQKKIKESAALENEAFLQKEKILVGSNKYENKEDRMQNDLELYPFVKFEPRKTLLEPIIEKRLAEEVEKERLKNESK
ncbi:methylmalonyl-CoA mutase subunit beta [Galbibacter mesophilus]|uniref:methylmalonyl-CoA mutase subunit beta n=1 Tax=Galbibacter mesophilus TaxID=379069 RepID=UPI00191D8E48|nr:methylmalonyl-CoA mutase subunit beta [Galbibacter mesophilus]MCM5663951.1 methylmalonyl-CoA mutase subunit beta [Galbibacter mesophilus]